MVDSLNIGVISIQGAVSEHIQTMQKCLDRIGQKGKVLSINYADELKNIDAVILPGGESTTISRILQKKGLHTQLIRKVEENNLAIMGTCAGCVILGKELVDNTDVKLLNLMDMTVVRNAFGRQKQSFETRIDIKGFSKDYNAVFIRAPAIKEVYKDCKVLSKIGKNIVMARQDNLLALSFHPELTDDLRIHTYFLEMI